MERTIFIAIITVIIVMAGTVAGCGGVEKPTNQVTLQYSTELDRNQQAMKMQTATPLTHTGEVDISWMDRNVWLAIQDTLLEQGVIAKEIEIDKVFTMQFLNKIYGKAE